LAARKIPSPNCFLDLIAFGSGRRISGARIVPAIREDDKPSSDLGLHAQTVQAAKLAHEMVDKSLTAAMPVYVGFHPLFAGDIFRGLRFTAPLRNEQGLAELKKWSDCSAADSESVIYCGCCPFEKMSYIRPAFNGAQRDGIQELCECCILPTSFVKDWAEKDFPIQKGI